MTFIWQAITEALLCGHIHLHKYLKTRQCVNKGIRPDTLSPSGLSQFADRTVGDTKSEKYFKASPAFGFSTEAKQHLLPW